LEFTRRGDRVVKPVAGEIVVIPFPRTESGKRRPALVIADLPGADLILCQITSRAHWDAFAVPLDRSDCERGQIDEPCFIRPQRLFTVEHHIILHSVGKVTAAKYDEVFKKTRALFID
jgi:mRNA interferase MazF